MKPLYFATLLLSLLLYGNPGFSQQYFKLLEKLVGPYEQKIARFSNGDILVGGSPTTGETSDQNGGLNLTRLDQCGNVSWAMNYQWKKNYIKFKDVKINEAQEIFVYGTAYESPNSEFIFLLKLNHKGTVMAFRVYHGGTVDNFTYNIQLRNGKILAYGLLLDWNTPKRGFMAIFDDRLNYEWAKVFEPFESVGEAIITDDNNFLGRSGFYHMQLNTQGNLQWASTLEEIPGSGLYPIAGPLAVNGGYIFEATYNDYAFFYKLDRNGKLIWKSSLFRTTSHAADMTLLPDGNIMATYNCPGSGENFPCQLRLSPDGNIIRQQKLRIDPSLQSASIYQSIGKNRAVNIIGSTGVSAASLTNHSGFLMQYSLDSLSGRCFEWEIFQAIVPNEITMEFSPLDLSFFQPRFTSVEASIKSAKREFTFTESCDIPTLNIIQIDTLLSCGQNWQVRLPNASFKWEDEAIGNPRTLERPGIYRASDNNCISPTTYEFNFKRDPCLCKVFLPTAFSPNKDGQNENLELFSNCNINQLQFSIYNRWGGKVFSSDALDASWDGNSRQKPAEPGIYVAVIRYQLLNDSNEMEEGSLVQNVQLIR